MSLEIISSPGGWSWIKGADAQIDKFLPLAPADVGNGRFSQLGAHIVGINQTYRDLLFVRAFFDPLYPGATWTQALWRYDYVGYMQVLQARVQGLPVNPKVFGGALGRCAVISDFEALDFMGVGGAVLQQDPGGQSILP